MAKQQNYKYKMSFVVPVYNVQEYVGELIDSILAQRMNFERDLQLVLVNDGSTDDSEKVCLEYRKRFPNNIVYIRQENAGPGAARNAGIAVAEGEYIGLPDADDKLSSDFADEIYGFFQKHSHEVDVVAMKWEFFEARTGVDHPLNGRFEDGDRVISLTEHPEMMQPSVATAVFKSQTVKRHLFDPKVGLWSEDLKYMGELFLDNPQYGVVAKPTYYYRKRTAKTSSQDTNRRSAFWYLETPKRTVLALAEYAQAKTGEVPLFVQHLMAYELKVRFKTQAKSPLNATETKEYKTLLAKVLGYVHDDVIMQQQNINIEYKLYMLTVKHGTSIYELAQRDDWQYKHGDTLLFDVQRHRPAVHPQLITLRGDSMEIEGYCTRFLFAGTKLQFKVGETFYDVEFVRQPHIEVCSLGGVIFTRNAFRVKLPLRAGKTICAFFVSGSDTLKLPIVGNSMSGFSNRGYSYRRTGNLLVKQLRNDFLVQPYSRLAHVKAEVKRLLALLKQQEYEAIWYRLAYWLAKPFYRKPIWLVADRIVVADDNGEVFFRYLSKIQPKDINFYFAISKDSPEYAGITKYGKVLDYYSFSHKLLFLLSSKVISSQAGDYAHNMFGNKLRGVMDLYDFDFVFLQHGIIRDDISGWLHRRKKNIKLFVTSAYPERESVLTGDYDYDERVVKLTGLPRHDNLVNNPQGTLILAPTWRKEIANEVDQATGKRARNETFKETKYYRFYQGVIDDKRLRAALTEHGMTGQLYLHPAFEEEINDFSGNEAFEIMQFPYDYPKAKSEGNLLVTDYSSVALDFAYLKKPVIYAQFDIDTFYDTHVSSAGYLDYEKEGVGTVVYDKEKLVDEIIKTVKGGCVMPGKYQKRVDKFFAYSDQNNCQRVYEAIRELDAVQGKASS